MLVTREKKLGTAEVECPMVYLTGLDVNACLDWNDYYYELWFEVNTARDYEWEELDMLDVVKETEKDLDDIAVIYCEDLDEVNRNCAKYSGDEQKTFFMEDETLSGIISC